MKYVDEKTRLEICCFLKAYCSPKTGRPLNLNSGRQLTCAILKSGFRGYVENVLSEHPNFQTVGQLAKCIMLDRDLLSCDTCGEELTYKQSFARSSHIGRHCSVRCALNDVRVKQALQDSMVDFYARNYGVRNCMQLPSTVEKRRRTFIEHYGADNNMKSEKGMREYRDSMREKYGVDCTWELSSVQEKRKNSCIARLGVEFPFQSPDIIGRAVKAKYLKNGGKYFSESSAESRRNTCVEHYGADNNMKSEKGMREYRDSMREKYGVDCTWELSSVQEKSKDTNLKRYGFSRAIKNDAVKEKAFRNRAKSYEYDGKHFDSAPEIALYMWLTDKHIDFEYQPQGDFRFEFNGETRRYFPDFRINGDFVELKGNQFLKPDGTWQCPFDHSLDPLYEAKRQCILRNGVQVLYENDYRKYMDYVRDTYGKDYLKRFKKVNSMPD